MEKERYHLLDGLRGLTLISMIAYHGMFDLVEIYGQPVGWFWKMPGYIWQQSICWTFILLSGFCWQMGSHPVRRGLIVSGGGLLVTAVTYLFMPSERILFGILSFTGAAMLLLAPLSKLLERIPASVGFLISAALFFCTRNINSGYFGFEHLLLGRVPEGFYQNYLTAALGFPQAGFFSGDYFSLLPWIFLYLCGYFLYSMFMKADGIKKLLRCRAGFLEWIGRHSLIIYLLHQPVLMLVWGLIF